MLPEQPVEVPDHAVAIRAVIVQIHPPIVRHAVAAGAPGGARQLRGQLRRLTLAQIDRDLSKRDGVAVRIGGATHDHRIAEIGAVLNPIEMNAKRRGEAGIELAVFDQINQRAGDQTGELSELRFLGALPFERNVIDVDDHPGS